MTFKESLQDDLDNVFFDSEELAAEHIIDGEKVIVVMQDFVYTSARTPGQQGSMINKKESATNKGSFLLYIRENDVKKLRRKRITAKSTINIDGKNYFVEDSKTSGGVNKVIIYLYQT